VNVDAVRRIAQSQGVMDLIEFLPAIPYREALTEMMRADALLVLQAANCNDQIPAKIYEYLRSGRPMLCLTDPTGDTAGVMRAAGLADITRLDSADEIAAALPRFLDGVRTGQATLPAADYVREASRAGRAQALAALCERAATSGRNAGQ